MKTTKQIRPERLLSQATRIYREHILSEINLAQGIIKTVDANGETIYKTVRDEAKIEQLRLEARHLLAYINDPFWGVHHLKNTRLSAELLPAELT